MKISLPGRRSPNLEDRRGAPRMRGAGMPIPLGLGAGLGIPGVIITVILLLVMNSGVLGGGGGGVGLDSPFQNLPGAQEPGSNPIPPESDPDAGLVDFVSAVLDDVQGVWADTYANAGNEYPPARLVLFEEATQTGCGVGSAATGPFYCPPDETVYLDLGFFRELASRFDAPGDFAQAYVIGHEIAHHLQNVSGLSEDVRAAQQRNPDEANELSIRLELQADCLAGVWGYTARQRGIVEDGDVEEALTAAAAIGDDRIQGEASGRTDPETWTHGSSEQRVTWFRRGFESGDPNDCDTFGGDI
jgi:predicted metalloprotease